MTPAEYSQAVIAERQALTVLRRRLNAYGSIKDTTAELTKVEEAWRVWHELAAGLLRDEAPTT